MNILLLEDVPNVGQKMEIVTVPDSFAFETLLPQRKALIPTPAVRKRYEGLIREQALSRTEND